MDELFNSDDLAHVDSILLKEVFRWLESPPANITREDLTSQRLTLLACLRIALERERDLKETLRDAGRKNRRLRQLSTVDPLTELANRRYFDLQLEKEWKRGARQNNPLSLLMLDIDHFKDYNDSLGHPAGDACLKQVAYLLADTLGRAADHVARIGGEEFALLLPDTDSEGAAAVAQKVLERLRTSRLAHPASPVASYVTLSAGLATCIPSLHESATHLVSMADLALYKAKQNGRDRYSISPSTHFNSTPLNDASAIEDPIKQFLNHPRLSSLLFRRANA